MSEVLVTQEFDTEATARIEAAGHALTYRDDPAPAPPDELRASAAGHRGIVCLLTDRIDAAFFDANPQVEVVANCAVGFDNVDVDAATAAGAMVTNTPGVLTPATADLTLALLLATARRVPEGDRFLREGRYTHWRLHQEQLGLDVTGRTLGIVGLGQIGRAVARRARDGFNMEVIYHNPSPLPPEDQLELGVRYAEMPELLATSDFVSIHAPATAATRGLFDAAAFRAMKRSAVLLNTARGPIVDEAALADALEAGEIAGAGLDVYEREPAVEPRLAAQTERVVLLPHLGSATEGTRRRMAHTAVDNALAALSGERPLDLVNPAVLAR